MAAPVGDNGMMMIFLVDVSFPILKHFPRSQSIFETLKSNVQ